MMPRFFRRFALAALRYCSLHITSYDTSRSQSNPPPLITPPPPPATSQSRARTQRAQTNQNPPLHRRRTAAHAHPQDQTRRRSRDAAADARRSPERRRRRYRQLRGRDLARRGARVNRHRAGQHRAGHAADRGLGPRLARTRRNRRADRRAREPRDCSGGNCRPAHRRGPPTPRHPTGRQRTPSDALVRKVRRTLHSAPAGAAEMARPCCGARSRARNFRRMAEAEESSGAATSPPIATSSSSRIIRVISTSAWSVTRSARSVTISGCSPPRIISSTRRRGVFSRQTSRR